MLLSTFYRSMVLRSQHDVSFTWKRGSMIDLSKMLTTDPITFGHIIKPPLSQKGKKGQVRLNMQIICGRGVNKAFGQDISVCGREKLQV